MILFHSTSAFTLSGCSVCVRETGMRLSRVWLYASSFPHCLYFYWQWIWRHKTFKTLQSINLHFVKSIVNKSTDYGKPLVVCYSYFRYKRNSSNIHIIYYYIQRCGCNVFFLTHTAIQRNGFLLNRILWSNFFSKCSSRTQIFAGLRHVLWIDQSRVVSAIRHRPVCEIGWWVSQNLKLKREYFSEISAFSIDLNSCSKTHPSD